MRNFDKRMAHEVIEDAFMDADTSHGRGVVTGLCGAFYMCGLLSEKEWKEYLRRIPSERDVATMGDGLSIETRGFGYSDRDTLLN